MSHSTPREVLVVEDEPLVRIVAADAIVESGVMAWEAGDAREALKVLAEHPRIGLIFTEVNMPGEMDGYGLCDNLKSSPEYEDIPVIMLTARGQLSDREAGLRAGADVYMVMPFSPIKLVDVVDNLLKNAKPAIPS